MHRTVNRRTLLKRLGSAGAIVAAGPMAAALGPPAQGQTRPPGRGIAPSGAFPEPDETLDLWPDGAPGMPDEPPLETVVERGGDPSLPDRAVWGITQPRLAVFRPPAGNGAAVMIMPGGSYQRIVIDKEGYEPGRWLAARGFTAFVLFYRLPGEGWTDASTAPLSDAQRAMRLIRERASQFGIDPERVAALGFSAGGHLCASLAVRFTDRTYDALDDADSLSARPFAAAPIYPVISMSSPVAHMGSRERLIGANATQAEERAHSPQHHVPGNAPPCFLVHAEDDASVPVENSLAFRAALRARGISVETHLFAEGGHGFGLRNAAGKPAAVWPELFHSWSQSIGLV